jgi:hypothetical protein
METLSPILWDLTHWARTVCWKGKQLHCSLQFRPWVGARVASPHGSTLRPGEGSVAEPDAAVQHRTNHLLIKPDILTCYQHRCSISSHVLPELRASSFQPCFVNQMVFLLLPFPG